MTTIIGTNLADVLSTAAAGDEVFGLAGIDEIYLHHDDAVAWGGLGDDIIQTNGATGTVVYGGAGADYVEAYGDSIAYGGAGDDFMRAYDHGSILRGDGGDDVLALWTGGAVPGNVPYNYMKANGGADADTFFLSGGTWGETLVHIRDFDASEGDSIQFGRFYDAGGEEVGPSSFDEIVWTDRTDAATGQDFVTTAIGDATIRIDDHQAADLSASDFAFI